MIKAHKIRLNPTPEQEVYFRKAVGTARLVYNWGLAEWKRYKAEHPGEEHGALALKKDFNALKLDQFPWVYDVAKDVAEGAFTNLAAALNNYFTSRNGKRRGKKVGFPKFKSKKNRRQSFRLNNDKIDVADHALSVPKRGWVNLAESLRFEGKIMGAVVSRSAGHWYVSLPVEMDPPAADPFAQPSVGVDLGLKTLAVLSDGTQYENQVLLRSELQHLRRLSRRLARRQRGSQRRWRTQRQLERFHARMANRRGDYRHKMTTAIAQTYAVIGLEDLNVDGMLKNHRLALSLADASLGEIRRQLEYKSAWFGGQTVLIDRFFPSSKRHHACGWVNADLDLSDREWVCPNCGELVNRDWNAADGIHAEALRLINQPR